MTINLHYQPPLPEITWHISSCNINPHNTMRHGKTFINWYSMCNSISWIQYNTCCASCSITGTIQIMYKNLRGQSAMTKLDENQHFGNHLIFPSSRKQWGIGKWPQATDTYITHYYVSSGNSLFLPKIWRLLMPLDFIMFHCVLDNSFSTVIIAFNMIIQVSCWQPA